MCVYVCVHVHGCMLLTTILKTVAGTRQTSPGIHKNAVQSNIVITLVTKAYLVSKV